MYAFQSICLLWPRLIGISSKGVVHSSGFNLAVFYIPVTERDKTRICIVSIKGKTFGVYSYCLDLVCLHHGILLKVLLHSL